MLIGNINEHSNLFHNIAADLRVASEIKEFKKDNGTPMK